MKTEETKLLKDLMTRYTSATILAEIGKYCEEQSQNTEGDEAAERLKESIFARTESAGSDDWGGSMKTADVESLRDLIAASTPGAVLEEIAENEWSVTCDHEIGLQD